jgi:hypothetical protein
MGRMYSTFKAALLTTLTIGAFATWVDSSARAQDMTAAETAAEIRQLKAQLNALEKRLDAQAHNQQQTQAELQRVVAKGPLPTTKGAPIEYCPPGVFCYKGLTITPGGYFALEGLWRSNNLISDIDTPFAAIPYPNNQTGHTNEFRLSARQSRLSLLVDGKVDPVTSLSGYAELDFLGAAQTANSNESNSYQPRIRNLYATIDRSDWGFHFLAGQSWSLATLYGLNGLKPRGEQVPLTIDAQYVPGFTWSREPQLRIVQDLPGNFQIGASAETAATIIGGSAPANIVANVNNACSLAGSQVAALNGGSGFSLLNACDTYSFNQVPDFVGKVAWNPTFGSNRVHFEAFGVLRQFTEVATASPATATQTFNSGTNTTWGGGGGGGVVAQIIPNYLDAQFSGMAGNGIGRYGTSQLPDVTFNNHTGQLITIPETQLLAGLIFHAFDWLDIYGYAGEEYTSAEYSKNSPAGVGWGNPLNVQTGCFVNFSTATCTAYKAPKSVGQLTAGFWDTIYKGDFGQVKWGLQYSYTQDQGFYGEVTSGKLTTFQRPEAHENTVMASFRYYPF